MCCTGDNSNGACCCCGCCCCAAFAPPADVAAATAAAAAAVAEAAAATAVAAAERIGSNMAKKSGKSGRYKVGARVQAKLASPRASGWPKDDDGRRKQMSVLCA